MGQDNKHDRKREVILLQALVIRNGPDAKDGPRPADTQRRLPAELEGGSWWPLAQWAEAVQPGVPAPGGVEPARPGTMAVTPADASCRGGEAQTQEGAWGSDLWVNSLALGALATFLATLLLLRA